eukprot:1139089-Pelagomonas_calceolata.AAC.1
MAYIYMECANPTHFLADHNWQLGEGVSIAPSEGGKYLDLANASRAALRLMPSISHKHAQTTKPVRLNPAQQNQQQSRRTWVCKGQVEAHAQDKATSSLIGAYPILLQLSCPRRQEMFSLPAWYVLFNVVRKRVPRFVLPRQQRM